MNAPALALLALALTASQAGAGAPSPQVCGLRFAEVAAAAAVSFRHDRGGRGEKHLPETMGAGLAWLDYDGDGWLDLYLVQSGPFPPETGPVGSRLFRGLGGGRFEDRTESARAEGRGYGQGVVAADADGDGWTDLYLTNYGANRLLRNRGDGSFEDSTAAAGVGAGGWSSSAAFADGDGDRDLDLYVTRYVRYDPERQFFCGDVASGRREFCDISLFAGENDLYFRNLGGGRFEDATAGAGFGGANGRGLGVLFTDLDGDLRPEIYVANDLTLNLLFRNRGDGTWEDVSLISGTAVNAAGKVEAGMGLAAADFDGDADLELAVTNFDVETNTLYRNLGELAFEDASAATGFGPPSYNFVGFGIVAQDLDLDGDVDVFVANGHVFEVPARDTVSYRQPDLALLWQDGRFVPAPCALPGGEPQVGRGLAAADFDEDGDLDLGLQNSGGPFQLLRNEIAGRSWLGVRLQGRGANTEAIGARVTLTAAGRSQTGAVLAGDSYQSASDRRVVFGLPSPGPAVDVEVRWPGGRRQVLRSVPPDRHLVVPEP